MQASHATDWAMSWQRWVLGKWDWKRPLKSIAFIYLCLFVVAVFFAEKLIFFPPNSGYTDNGRLVKFGSSNGDTIAAIDLPGQPGFPTILYTHGNAEDLGTVEDLLQLWNGQGFGVLAYDFPGYSHSTGKSVEKSCEAAILAAWNHLTGTKKLAPSSIVIVGRSVGSGPSVWLAAQKQPGGLLLLSPFTSIYRVPFGVPLFPRDRFPNLERIPQVKCPLLIVHGEADKEIPVKHGRHLFEAATVADKQFLGVPAAGHNDLLKVGSYPVEGAIRKFILRVGQPPN